MKMAYLCGIDLGTSSLKTLLMDEQGSVKGVPISSHRPGADLQSRIPGNGGKPAAGR